MGQSSKSGTFRQRSGLDPLVAFGLAGALIFFLISGVVEYRNLETLRDNTQKAIHSHEVNAELDQLLSNMQDAETGQRGFLLTNNDRYLQPYDAALAAVRQRLDHIARLTSDSPAQQARIPRLRQLIDSKLADLNDTIELRRTRGFDAALAAVASGQGKADMDAIRAQIAAMDLEESGLRGVRVAETNDAYATALAGAVVAGLVGILLTAIIGFLIRRTTLARQREDWLQSGHVALGSAVLGDQPIDQLGHSILEFLARYVGSVAGVIFVRNNDVYVRTSSYGVPVNADIPERFALREGLLGQVAAESRPLTVGEVPDGYLAFGSALGQDKPRHLVISPGIVDGGVNTVIELGFLRPVGADGLS